MVAFLACVVAERAADEGRTWDVSECLDLWTEGAAAGRRAEVACRRTLNGDSSGCHGAKEADPSYTTSEGLIEY